MANATNVSTPLKLVFSIQPPVIETSGTPLISQPIVQVLDSSDTLLSSASNSVTLTPYTDPSCTVADSGTITATTNPLSAIGGSATFGAVTYTGTKNIVYIGASAPGLTSACSSAIAVISPDIRAVSSSGGYHTCALTSGGNVYCWGNNASGELGNSTTTNSLYPVEVTGVGGSGFLSGIISISAGYNNTCAVSSSGNAYCWGFNGNGQIGNNTTTESSTPVEVIGVGGTGFLSDVTSISVDSATACASTSTGGVYCWGAGSSGALGNNGTADSHAPVKVSGVGNVGFLSGIISVSVNTSSACAIASTGSVYCWGDDMVGELGNNSTSQSNTPVQVLGLGGVGFLSDIRSISAQGNSACAVSTSGNVFCWGDNTTGALGNNTTSQSSIPVEVVGVGGSGSLFDIVSVALSSSLSESPTSCALSSFGNVYCWGNNSAGGLGNNTTTDSLTPVEVVGAGGTGFLSTATSITAGGFGACATLSSGNVYCWGYNNTGQLGVNSKIDSHLPVEVLVPGMLSASVGGLSFTCGLSRVGNAYCWGDNISGVLGNNTINSSETPVEVVGVGAVGFLSNLTSVAVGYEHVCALSSSGNVYCWGDNTGGALGNNSTTTSHTPVEVVGVGGVGFLSNITALSAGTYVACGLSTSGNVYCWGRNTDGVLGNGTNTDANTPVEVVGVGGTGFLSNVVAIGAGDITTCAIDSSGQVYCWGFGGRGALGNNSNSNSFTPVQVLGVGGTGFLSGVTSLGGGDSQCATSAGHVYCWGANTNGELGNNTTSNSSTPVEVFGVGAVGNLSSMTTAVSGSSSSCSLSSSGDLYCWGANIEGEIGNNSTTDSHTPVQVLGVGAAGFLVGVAQVSTEASNTCATTSAGDSYCWGAGSSGQIGNNSTTDSSTPVQVVGLPPSVYLQL